jgi:hypothetical protein
MKGSHGQRCYGLAAGNGHGILGGTVCGDPDRPPVEDWSQVLGAGTQGPRGGSLVLQITSRRVHRLRILTGPRPLTWVRANTKTITNKQAREAHLHRNFSFSVIHARGRLCIRQAVAFSGSGRKLGSFRRPCEL